MHRDLGTGAGIARGTDDLQQLLLDLRHFQFEQLDQQFRRCSRQDHLRSARAAIHAQQVRLDAIADAQVFLGDHLVARQQGFDLAEFDDRIAALEPLYRAGHQMFLAFHEVGQNLLAFGVPDLLEDHLLRGLRADTPEIYGFQRLFDEFTDLDFGIAFLRFFQLDMQIRSLESLVVHHFPAAKGFIGAGITIDLDPHVRLVCKTFLRRGGQGRFQRLEHDFLVHVLFAGQCIYQQQNFTTHTISPEYFPLIINN